MDDSIVTDDSRWEMALNQYQNVIASGDEALQAKATLKLALLAKYAPLHLLPHTIPILAKLLSFPGEENDSLPVSVEEAAAYCLRCISCLGDGSLAVRIGQAGVVRSILRLLPLSGDGFRMALIKCLLCLVNFGKVNRELVFINGGLEVIIDMLGSYSGREKVYVLEILSALALVREVRRVLSSLGGVKFLVEAVSLGSMVSRERACQAVGLLGVTRRGRSMLVELGVIPALVDLFRDGDATAKLVAGNSLGVISAHVDFIRPVAQAGAIPLYAELLQGPDPTGKEIAEDVFCILAVAEENFVSIAEHLVRILREGDDEAKIAASDVLWDLSGYKRSVSVIRNLGAIPILVQLLRHENGEVREKVSGAIAQLSYDECNREALADVGAVAILIELLDDDLEDLRDNAAEALLNFSEDPFHRDLISEAVDVPSFESMQDRLTQLRASDEYMVRSLRRMSIEHLTWNSGPV
ncbi:hypothetical protein Tsubulata_027965 [Turnera subulata]|uniref:Armadillo repeat-containing domain-containing protein n=1 Tax=Turnera subulata TaxID=218843 RepID=A0A9Q0FTB0_9ROSI|nr:hypothetical protein Tsubulata_027965 [Turnera subulata]